MSRTTKQNVVGFIVGNIDEDHGKFVKTLAEVENYLTDNGAEVDSYSTELSDGWRAYLVTDKGDLKCLNVMTSGIKVSLPYNYKMAAEPAK